MPHDEAVEALVRALEDKRFRWRTLSGLAEQSGLAQEEVTRVLTDLKKAGVVIRSDVPAATGEELFTTRQHFEASAPLGARLSAAFRNRAS